MASEMALSRAGHGLLPISFKFSCYQDRCGKKDRVFPLLVHLSPLADNGENRVAQRPAPANLLVAFFECSALLTPMRLPSPLIASPCKN
jgi:hypothetical protein